MMTTTSSSNAESIADFIAQMCTVIFQSGFKDKPIAAAVWWTMRAQVRFYLAMAAPVCRRNMFAAVPLLGRRVYSSVTARDTTYR